MFQPFLGIGRIGLAGADGPAQAGEPLHTVQIVTVIADATHPGHWLAFCGFDTHRQAVGNGKNFGLDAVGLQNAVDAFFHPEGFCTAHGQFVSQIRC